MSKEGWTIVSLGDIAENISERVNSVSESEFERWVGLAHIDYGSVKVTRWGAITEANSSGKVFRAGDVLLPRRFARSKTAQQERRAAEVDFNGVCSGDAYVLREKPGAILPGLLKYILNTNRFWEYAVANADGSMSTRVKLKHVIDYKIKLQNFEAQAKLLAILDQMVEYGEKNKQVISLCERIFANSLREMSNELLENYPCEPLEKLATVSRGKFSHRPRNLPEFYGGGIPFVQTGDIQHADRYVESYNYTLTDVGITHSKQFEPGTIFMTIAANIGSTAISNEAVYATDSVVGIRPNDDISVEFLELILRNYKWHLEFEVATQTAQKNISLQNIKPLNIPICTSEEQERFSRFFLTFWRFSRQISFNLQRLDDVMMTIVNNNLGVE